MDARQHTQLFGYGRIARTGRDETRLTPGARHVTVVHRDRFYSVDVLAPDGRPIAPLEVQAGASDVRLRGAKPPRCLSVGNVGVLRHSVGAEPERTM